MLGNTVARRTFSLMLSLSIILSLVPGSIKPAASSFSPQSFSLSHIIEQTTAMHVAPLPQAPSIARAQSSFTAEMLPGTNMLSIVNSYTVFGQRSDDDHLIFMPVIQNSGRAANLDNLGTVEHADGVGLGAYGTTLSHPIHVEILSAAVPTTPLPAAVQALAGYYQIGADANIYVSTTAPFVLAFPVPTGAPVSNLAVGVLMSDEDYLDGESSEPVWEFLDGKYDSARDLFLTTIPFLAQDGRTFVLVDHPDITSLPNQSQLAKMTGPSAPGFVAICRGFHAGECPESTEDQVESLLAEMYSVFSNLGYPEPRLKVLSDVLEWPPTSDGPVWLSYPIYLEPQELGTRCFLNDGRYSSKTGHLALCADDWTGGIAYQSDRHKNLIHEYFHALQYGFSAVLADRDDFLASNGDWIIDGMATAVQESYFVAGMKRSAQRELLPVDISIAHDLMRYRAQDFWVYVGQINGLDMGYFRHILIWGASTESVNAAMPTLGFFFPDMVWRWSKNQFVEKEIDTDGALGTPCVLDQNPPVADQANFYRWSPLSQSSLNGTIPPLTSAIVLMTWSSDPYFPVTVFGTPLSDMKYKVYVESETICDGTIPDGQRTLTIDHTKTYYILLTNTSHTDPVDFQVFYD